MYRIDVCPCCGNHNLSIWPALLSPFILEYATEGTVGLVDLALCLNCGFQFFLNRYDKQEVSTLYANYRSEQYYKVRHSYEFYYTRTFNASLGNKEIEHRKAHLSQLLDRNNILTQVSSILDYGGDRGQFIPDTVLERYVYEISGLEPVPGVTRLEREEDLVQRSFDLVMLCHVLEHCSDPVDIVRKHAKLNVKFIYIEVPAENFRIIRIMPAKWYRKYVRLVSGLPRFLKAVIDLFTIACRLKLRVIPPFAVINESEHINYFTKPAISQLFMNNGFEPIEINYSGYRWPLGDKTLFCLARKKVV